jgi:hypothetical protein
LKGLRIVLRVDFVIALGQRPAVPPLIEFRYAVDGEEEAGDKCWYPPTVTAYASDEGEGDCRGAPDADPFEVVLCQLIHTMTVCHKVFGVPRAAQPLS